MILDSVEIPGEKIAPPESEAEFVSSAPFPSFQIPAFLKAPTGPGSIEDYIHHPMNFGENKDFARILRGLTGMFNTLNYAIIDIVVGAFKYFKKEPPKL